MPCKFVSDTTLVCNSLSVGREPLSSSSQVTCSTREVEARVSHGRGLEDQDNYLATHK